MITYLYDWVERIAIYIIILTAVTHLLPNNSYKKYIQFFVGLLLILMLTEPIQKLFQLEHSFAEFYQEAEYELHLKEMKDAAEYYKEIQP